MFYKISCFYIQYLVFDLYWRVLFPVSFIKDSFVSLHNFFFYKPCGFRVIDWFWGSFFFLWTVLSFRLLLSILFWFRFCFSYFFFVSFSSCSSFSSINSFSLIFSSCYSQIDSEIFFGILISHGIIFFIPVSVLFSVEFFESLPLLRFICRLFFYKLRFSIFLFFTGFAFHLSVNSFSI